MVTLLGANIDHVVLRDFVIQGTRIERYNEIVIATDEEDTFFLFDANDSFSLEPIC